MSGRSKEMLFLLTTLCFVFSLGETEDLGNSKGRFCKCEKCNCTCNNIFSIDDLRTDSSRFPKCKLFTMQLENSILPFLPRDLFSRVQESSELSEFHFELLNSTLYLLSPHSKEHSPFRGIRFNRAEICITRSSTLIGWRWEALEELSPNSEGLLSFSVMRSELPYLPDEFSKVAKGKISAVRFFDCKLRWLGDNVFAPLSELQSLELRGNLLENIKRSQLPQKGSQLKILDLGDNKLSHIPNDLLKGLKLNTFYIDKNNILCLEVDIMPQVQKFGWKEMKVCENQTAASDNLKRKELQSAPGKIDHEDTV